MKRINGIKKKNNWKCRIPMVRFWSWMSQECRRAFRFQNKSCVQCREVCLSVFSAANTSSKNRTVKYLLTETQLYSGTSSIIWETIDNHSTLKIRQFKICLNWSLNTGSSIDLNKEFFKFYNTCSMVNLWMQVRQQLKNGKNWSL